MPTVCLWLPFNLPLPRLQGLLPYDVFMFALCETPSRLLSHELILDKAGAGGKNGLENSVDIALCVGEAKIIYPKCKKGVFPPSGFDPQVAFRSMMLPRAHMYLEHVYGYAGGCWSILGSQCHATKV